MTRRSPEILVVGASGLVGGRLAARFGTKAAGTYSSKAKAGLLALDITDAAACRSLIGELRPRVVVHTAALTHVDLCEREPERSRAVNVDGTRNVAIAAAEFGARHIYFSTDYVFGSDQGPHPLSETPSPLNEYGRHKLEAERIVATTVEDHVIVRACNLYGYEADGMNFVMAVWKSLNRGERMRVPEDQWGSPTLAEDLSEAIVRLLDSDVRGVVHLAGPDYVNRLELGRRAATAFGLDPGGIEGVPTTALSQAAVRPLAGGLDADQSCERVGCRFRGLNEGLERVAAQLRDR
ncbi:MAG: NAD(P)-dependent oxidoreductase [Myxococcales bacterium]|nr:MAG: NAD(P)-dependent oxidoreductase [Myxococcales bacterium]